MNASSDTDSGATSSVPVSARGEFQDLIDDTEQLGDRLADGTAGCCDIFVVVVQQDCGRPPELSVDSPLQWVDPLPSARVGGA